jgi:hypothetical protein
MPPKKKARKPRKTRSRRRAAKAVYEKEIVIQGASAISVSPDPVHLSRGASHRARWRHQNGNIFFAQFQGASPFAGHIFYTGKAHSGKITYTGSVPQEFKYQVGVSGYSLDPRVIIDP